jgi:hypothetical protein
MAVIAALLISCESPAGAGNQSQDTPDGPGAITAPANGAALLIGDTIEIAWTNEIDGAQILYNYNDSMENFTDAQWHVFDDTAIISIGRITARVLPEVSKYTNTENFRLRVTDPVSGKSSETGSLLLDNVVLLKPAGGESYSTGQQVPIRFKRNKFLKRVLIYLAIGKNAQFAVSLTEEDINFGLRGEGDKTTTFDTTWTIGEEKYYDGSRKYPSDSCYIYAFSYYLGESFAGSFAQPGLDSDRNRTPFVITQ